MSVSAPTNTPHPGPRVVPGVIGITLNLGWALFLFGICAFDNGHLSDARWVECIMWCALVGLPASLAWVGIAKQDPKAMAVAGWMCLPLLVISLAGAGLPLLIPAFAYWISAARSRSPHDLFKITLIALGVIWVLGVIAVAAPTVFVPVMMLYSIFMYFIALCVWSGLQFIQAVVAIPWLWISGAGLVALLAISLLVRKRA